MDTRQVIARFEAERQALAMMDHPNIAKVLDSGETAAGRPFFVMELVRGIPITEYCDKEKLKTEERLDLFTHVCHAVQHAHQKGIIHRDIKPSNVLVAFQDGAPVAKVIDFGIAKATQVRLTDKTLFTSFEQFIGTPAYMSPEQAEMSRLDIDTRSDIYSLGVLLYELLTGRTPFDTRELLNAGLNEIRRVIREDDPPRPSTKLTSLNNGDLDAVARNRRSEPPRLIRIVRGDLDWIVMKALEKERTHRYDTATELARDIQRHLQNEPIVARPAGAWEKTLKWTKRHPATASVVIVTFLALLACAGLAVYASRQAVLANRNASEARTARLAAEKARQEATETLEHILGNSTPAFRIERFRLVRHSADGAEAEFAMDYRFDRTNSEPAHLILTVGKSGESGVARWFGCDPVPLAKRDGTIRARVKFFNDEPGVPRTFTSDYVRVCALNDRSKILGLTDVTQLLRWGTGEASTLQTNVVEIASADAAAEKDRARRLAEAQARQLAEEKKLLPGPRPGTNQIAALTQLKTRVTNVDVVNRSADRSEFTFGIEFEYAKEDGLSQPLLGVEVFNQSDRSLSPSFQSHTSEIGRSRRNFVLFPVKYIPADQPAKTNSFRTDRVVVYLLDPSTQKRYDLFETAMLLSWSAPAARAAAPATE